MPRSAAAPPSRHHALIIGRSVRAWPGIADALECLGTLSTVGQDQRKAPRLLGAGTAIRRATGYQRFALHQTAYDAAVTALRTSIGEAAFMLAFDEVGSFTADDAVSYALQGHEPGGSPNSR